MSTPSSVGTQPYGEFRNEPPTDFSQPEAYPPLKVALDEIEKRFPDTVPLIIGGKRIETTEKSKSLDPSNKEVVVAFASIASEEQVDEAVETARAAFASWSKTPAEERAGILVKAAGLMRERKQFFAAVMVREGGKPPREAIADVDEAIDFLEYYAREMVSIAPTQRLQPYLKGEENDTFYFPIGVVGVIAPWNFPLAIPVGMSCAAIVAGNCVVMKPAGQAPFIARQYVDLMEEAGLPKGVLNLIPGRGSVAGLRLVKHSDVNMIIFTGSREVGLMITREAAIVPPEQHFVKRVVTEMGGKNGLIVDSSADIEKSIPDALYSAFGFSGQKCSACSRLIVLEDIYDEYVAKLAEAAKGCVPGEAYRPDIFFGPMVDGAARDKVNSYIELGKETAKPLYIGELGELKDKGFFAPCAIFEVDSKDHRLMQEEIFGPVLAVIKAKDFDEAMEIANSTPYALTGGVHSQNEDHLDRARVEFAAGNLYLNRTTTGAIVARQPFGGFRLSGIGTKAGGTDYLRQFLNAKVVARKL